MKLHPSLIPFVTLLITSAASADDRAIGYYRFPAIHNRTLVFTSEGDLWRVPIKGGTAQRLTTHPEVESHAEISPDGTTIAFTAAYEGPAEIYTMPVQGGLPTRITWEGYSGSRSPYPVCWKSASELVYATRYFARRDPFQLAIHNLTDHSSSVIPLEQASDGQFNSDTLFFTRLPRQSSHAKRYTGGLIEKLWKFTPGDRQATPLTAEFDGTSRSPMIWKKRLYFVTDRDGCMNLWSMTLDAEDRQQHTHFKDWDVLTPSLHKGRIAFQLGADIWVYNTETQKAAVVPIRLTSDFDQQRTRWLEEPLNYLTHYDISADGKKIALTVRGRGFVAPVKPGRLVSLPQQGGTRFRDIMFLPKTDQVCLLSDETGETEFWQQPADGNDGHARQITKDAAVLRFNGLSSPDGKQVAYTDRDQLLWLLDVESGNSRKVAFSQDGTEFDSPDLAWSPDSRWLAFSDYGSNAIQRVFLFDTAAKGKDVSPVAVTTDRLDSYSPAFSAGGKWLYFLTDRTFRSVQRSPWGPRQPEAYLDRTTSIYALDLTGGQRSPFAADTELTAGSDENKSDEKSEPKGETQKSAEVTLDLHDLSGRLHPVPLDAGNYSSLTAAKGHLYFVSSSISLNRSRNLMSYPITKDASSRKTTTVATGIGSYRLSSDRSTVALRNSSRIYAFPASGSKPDLSKSQVSLSGLEVEVRPAIEWNQIFVDAWRLHRDYFYDRNMHAVDWKEVRTRHESLLPRVSDRHELDNLIAMMVGELSAMHTNIYAGNVRQEGEAAELSSLGGILRRVDTGYEVTRIYQNDPDFPNQLAPIARPGVDVKVGDVITAIDGRSVTGVVHINTLLLNKAGRQTLLTTTRRGIAGERKFIVRPLSHADFRSLKLSDWEYTRRQETENRSNGQIGYFHMRAMSTGNFSEFVKGFYPVFNRQGLIIDMRQNYGGNIDSWILGRLMRKAWMYWQGRSGEPYSNMHYAFNGHMVVLIDAYTISDGEAFSEGFRRLGLGPLIGTKTWGGGIWLRSNNRLVDGGLARSPEFGVYSPQREWIIEGSGVSPDITVMNDPHQSFNGTDAQLEAAIKYLKKKIEEDPRPMPRPPKHPDKSKP